MKEIISEPEKNSLGETAGLKLELAPTIPHDGSEEIILKNFWSSRDADKVHIAPEEVDDLIKSLKQAKEEAKV